MKERNPSPSRRKSLESIVLDKRVSRWTIMGLALSPDIRDLGFFNSDRRNQLCL